MDLDLYFVNEHERSSKLIDTDTNKSKQPVPRTSTAILSITCRFLGNANLTCKSQGQRSLWAAPSRHSRAKI